MSAADKMRNWLPTQAPGWLRRGAGDAWLEETGGALDQNLGRVRQAAKGPLPLSDDAEALAYVGRERQMVRGPAETEAAYRARCHDAWEAHAHAGSAYGILQQLRALGYTATNGNPVLVQQNGLGLSLDASGALGKTLLGPNPPIGGNQPLAPGVTEWWTFDALGTDANNDQYNARFGLLFPSVPAGWAAPTDPPVVGPTLAEVNTIRRVVNQWRAGEARFMGIWLKTTGFMWGWGMTWGAFVWGGGVVYWGPEET